MDVSLQKLSPHRDLQCYFEHPSAIATISNARADGFSVSGCWRQQFDWAVIEWNRDNVFEHPAFRYLPDGDLSGLVLTYEEERTNCIAVDSDLYPTVDWPYLRIWCDGTEPERFHRVPLLKYAEPIEGQFTPATATFELAGSATAAGFVALSWMWEHYVTEVNAGDSPCDILDALVLDINSHSSLIHADRIGTAIQLTFVPPPDTPGVQTARPNGNRLGVYSSATADCGLLWNSESQYLSGGTLPTKWRYVIPFAELSNEFGATVPTSAVRKMRWTYSADLQQGAFQRSEFEVRISNWSVTGDRRTYTVAGPGSRRIDDSSPDITYSQSWTSEPGNYSGGTIRFSAEKGAVAACTYNSPQCHSLYVGTRNTPNGGLIEIWFDGVLKKTLNCRRPGEDFLQRLLVAEAAPGAHSVIMKKVDDDGTNVYFDFFEIAIPESALPAVLEQPSTTLATDWDTDHSIAVAPERTAWMIRSLGFLGRVNHYVGAMWFYELTRSGHEYASASLTFAGDPVPGTIAVVEIWRKDIQPIAKNVLQHGIFIGDTGSSVTKAFEMQINGGYTGIRAEAHGNVLTVFSRAMGSDGNQLAIAASVPSGSFTINVSDDPFTNGEDGVWITDVKASPILNRAARDWSRGFYVACKSFGLDAAAAFSTELRHGDTTLEAGIAQRYPSGNAVVVNTPATQTNFSPASLAFWREIYLCMARVMQEAGVRPYLQFGEVQYWYFPDDGSGLPFSDEYTKARFRAAYGREIATIANESVLPADHPEEAALLPQLIGEFTSAVMQCVRSAVPDTRFEVLYPVDVNDTPFNRAVNFPALHWTPAVLDNLKTESFTYTYGRNLNLCQTSVDFPGTLGFPVAQRSHLIGIGDPVSPWAKEVSLAHSSGVESVVLFALDQFCLIGYPLSVLNRKVRRSVVLA